MEQIAGIDIKTVFYIIIMLTVVLGYNWWFDRKPVEFKRMHHKKLWGILLMVIGGVTYMFFPSDKNMVLLMLSAVLLYLVNSRLVHYCAICGKTIRTNMVKQVPEQCPYCRSLYTPPGKFDSSG